MSVPGPTAGGRPPGAAGTARPSSSDVLRFANRAHGFLMAIDAPDLAGRVEAEAARWGDTELSVVVAGDIKRGKSSLVNSLVGVPGLLPVEADVATSVHLVVRHADRLGVRVTRIDDEGQARTTDADPGELVAVASMQGAEADRRGVVSVEVGVDAPLLARGVSFVDTPGVGGMSRGHRDITMAALARADVLLFAISAQEPVARTEIEFLAEASERIDHVVFVVTKADLNTDEANAALAEENRAKLVAYRDRLARRADEGDERARELVARFERLLRAPYALTSSLLADQAARRAEAGRAEQAARYRARSGFDRLEAMLARSVERREDVRLTNVAQVVGLALAEAAERLAGRARAADGDTAVAAEVAAQQAALEELSSKQARWRNTLSNSLQRMQANLGRTIARELGIIRANYRAALEATTDVGALVASLGDDLDRSLRAAWANLAAAADAGLAGAIDEVAAEVGIDAAGLAVADMAMPADLIEAVRQARVGTQDFSLLDDGVPLAMQTFTFANIAHTAGGLLGIATGGIGFAAYGVGAGLSFALTKLRKQGRERHRTIAEYQRVLNEALFGSEGMAKEFQTELSLRVIDARARVEQAVEERLGARKRDLERRSRELAALARAEASARLRERAAIDKYLADLAGMREASGQLHAALRASLAL